MCLGISKFLVHVCVERECCFSAVVGWPTPARNRQSEPNHIARKMARNMRTQHEESRRVFGPAGPHFSRPANHFRNAVTECRCESCVSACKVPTKSPNCASAEAHAKDQETLATARCLANQVNFPMLLKLCVAPGSINHPPLRIKNM